MIEVHDNYHHANIGITLRQKFAESAMLGLLANPSSWATDEDKIASLAVAQADALIRALETRR